MLSRLPNIQCRFVGTKLNIKGKLSQEPIRQEHLSKDATGLINLLKIYNVDVIDINYIEQLNAYLVLLNVNNGSESGYYNGILSDRNCLTISTTLSSVIIDFYYNTEEAEMGNAFIGALKEYANSCQVMGLSENTFSMINHITSIKRVINNKSFVKFEFNTSLKTDNEEIRDCYIECMIPTDRYPEFKVQLRFNNRITAITDDKDDFGLFVKDFLTEHEPESIFTRLITNGEQILDFYPIREKRRTVGG